jgi:hypothetical protein
VARESREWTRISIYLSPFLIRVIRGRQTFAENGIDAPAAFLLRHGPAAIIHLTGLISQLQPPRIRKDK